jgi:DNA-binding MarR family transcriptional regulator
VATSVERSEQPDGPEALVNVHQGFQEEFPDGSALSTECFLNLGRVATSMLRELDRLLDQFGVPSYSGFNALTVMAGADELLPPSVVAQRMVVSRPTVTGILRTLEHHGLVTRAPHGPDGRTRPVILTDAGHDVVRRALPEVHRFEHELFGALDHDQQKTLMEILQLLNGRLESADLTSRSAHIERAP